MGVPREEDLLFLALDLSFEELVQLLDRALVDVGEALSTRSLIEDILVKIASSINVDCLELDRELDLEI